MFVYFLNIISICIYSVPFLFLGEKTKLKKTFFLIVCFVQCWIIAAIRDRVGWDYGMYWLGFVNMRKMGFSDFFYEDWEVGYILLNKIIGLFTENAAVLMAVVAFISLAGPFYLIWKHSKNPLLSVMIYLNTHMYYMTFNFLRQSIAISILCFAYGFMKDRKVWQFLLLCGIAATFHLSALYMIPVFFICWIKLSPKTLPIYAAGTLIYFLFADMAIKFIFSYFHKEYEDSQFLNSGVAIRYAICPVIISVMFVALMFYLKFRMSKHLNMLCHLVMLTGFWQLVMLKHALFERLSYYSMIFLIMAFPEAIEALKETYIERKKSKLMERDELTEQTANEAALRKSKLVVVIATSAVMLVAVAYHMVCLMSTYSKQGVHGALPYLTHFDLNIPYIDDWFIKS